MVAARINFQQGAKRNLKPMETKEKQQPKGKNHLQNSSKGNSSNNKAKEKGVYKGKNRLTPEELERYRKDNRCFKCGDQGHSYRTCPQRNARNEQPRASIIEAPKEDVHCKGSPLSYAWGKVREHDAFILFDPGSTHNFISHELAAKLGIQEFEMGDAMKADGAFIGQDASVTPLIGKLRLHTQGYVDKEEFLISPLKHEDVILGAPWFDRLAASIKFLERKISFKFRAKDIYIVAQESSSTIPLVNDQAFDKSIRIDLYNNGLSHAMDIRITHSLVVTHICDKIINTTHICAADHEAYLKGLPEKDRKLIANVWRSHAKGVEPWFPFTRKYLGRLVYDVQITKEFQIRKEKVKKALSKEGEDKILHDIVQKYCDRMRKMLNIVDPSLGTDWLARVLGLKWGVDSWATLEMINMIATHDAPVQSKIFWISLLEGDMVIKTA
ncbi:hypothetical protein L7F22_031126 [Adiantum nelumboides]|nr:hypothetical protein [Adiantum nelumboides]